MPRSRFIVMQAILCGSLLILSFTLPYERLSAFPELWKPIPPFAAITVTDPLLRTLTWAWRLTLMLVLIMPRQRWWLAAACLCSFACLGLRNCFTLEIQLYASLELALIVALLFGTFMTDSPERDADVAFAMKLIVVLLYFSAGVAKLKLSGTGWAMSETVPGYVRMLVPLKSDCFAFALPWRTTLAMSPSAVKVGAVAAHLFELVAPVALVSRLGSRIMLIGSALFVIVNSVLLGIAFFTVIPLLVIWALYDVRLQDIAHARRASLVAMAALVIVQLAVTLVLGRNLWPVMANDMYAKPMASVPYDDLHIDVVRDDGQTVVLHDSASFAPFSKFHVLIALQRLKDQAARDALLAHVLQNYRDHTCTASCDGARSIVAILVKDGIPHELGRAEIR